MRGIDYLLKENKIKTFFTSANRCRERIVQRFNPGVEIVHVIAKKFNPVNRAEFNPEVESSPCNRPLSAPTTINSLAYIINLVICKGIIPADWKSARVSAIHKNDSKLDLNNYRPISVLPVIAKVLGKSCLIKPTIFSTTTIFYLKSSLVLDTFILH